MITLKKIKIYINGALDSGPSNVVIKKGKDCEPYTARLSKPYADGFSEIILVREDGWTLGCERKNFDYALKLPHNWVAYAEKPYSKIVLLKEKHLSRNK